MDTQRSEIFTELERRFDSRSILRQQLAKQLMRLSSELKYPNNKIWLWTVTKTVRLASKKLLRYGLAGFLSTLFALSSFPVVWWITAGSIGIVWPIFICHFANVFVSYYLHKNYTFQFKANGIIESSLIIGKYFLFHTTMLGVSSFIIMYANSIGLAVVGYWCWTIFSVLMNYLVTSMIFNNVTDR